MELNIRSITFEEDGTLYAYGDCPRETCEGMVYEVGCDYVPYACTGTQRHTLSRNELNIVEADDTQIRSHIFENTYNKVVGNDKIASSLIAWWGFEIPKEFRSGNNTPGGYLHYEVYKSLMKIVCPDKVLMPERVFDELVWRMWR